MQVHQNLSILFYRKKKKADKKGFIPIYCRITIDGLEDERSTGVKVLDHQWDTDAKQVLLQIRFFTFLRVNYCTQ